jgi:hypothetical protein
MLIKNLLILTIHTLFLLNSSVKAEGNSYISGNNEDKITQRIDSFFTKYPNKKRVFWQPEIKGKSRYVFSIPKGAYLISKKYLDGSDLYYLSEKIDNGLKFESNKSKSIDLFIIENNYKAIFKQSFSSKINAGIFFEKKDNTIGMILDKNFIILKNTLGNFRLEQAKDQYTKFTLSSVKLIKNEKSELYGNISYKLKSNILNVKVGYTWFDIINQFDFTANIYQNDNKVTSEIYSSFGQENMKFKIGLNQIKNNSNMDIFFNLRFENIIGKKDFESKINVSSKNDIITDNNLSLKKYRKQSLDNVWRKNFKF